MNSTFVRAAAAAASLLLWFSPPLAGAALPCAVLAKKVREEVRGQPDRVLIVVEDAMVQNETCACEIVKSAIVAARAGGKLVGQIVITAVGVSPGMAPTIGECALAAVPEAAAEIKSALHKAFSDGALPGRVPAAPAPEPAAHTYEKGPAPAATKELAESADGVASGPVAIAGIYLIMPSGSPPPTQIQTPGAPSLHRLRPNRARVMIRPPDVTAGASDDPPS